MNLLIAELDKESNKLTPPTIPIPGITIPLMTVPMVNMKQFTNNQFDQHFPENYEAHFKKYNDLDKCNDGFMTKIIKIPEKPAKKRVTINHEINQLDDLITLTEKYPLYENVVYDINIKGVHQIKELLKELISFVGLEELKETLMDQLIYFMHSRSDDYLHTVLYGPPGTGKTEIAKILGKIYTKLGILSKGSFVKVTRSDFVAGFLGQTAIKTRKLIEDNVGGVIFIDEAYAMGNQEQRDMFSKEALDTLCELLSEHKKDLMVIIAGYREELDKCFFSYNPGLESRFAWQFEIHKYNAKQLSMIFSKKVNDGDWYLEENVGNEEWFEENMDSFKSYGRDVENLFSKCKICHFRRVFGRKEMKHELSHEDLSRGFNKFKNLNNGGNKKESTPNFMYT